MVYITSRRLLKMNELAYCTMARAKTNTHSPHHLHMELAQTTERESVNACACERVRLPIEHSEKALPN